MENLDTSVSTKFSHLWTCYLEFENVSRISGENLGDFLNRWKEKMSNAQSAGCNYSDALLACKLLERSNLDGDAFQSIINFIEDSGQNFFSEMLSRLKGSTTQENPQFEKNFFISSVFGPGENEGRVKLEIHEDKKDLPEIHVKEEDLLEIHEEWIEKSPNDAEIQSPEKKMYITHDFAQQNSDQFSCEKCNKSLKFLGDNTLSYDHVTGNIICKDCDISPGKLAKSRKENKEDLLKKSRTCHICDKTFSRPYVLQNHMVRHTKEKNFKCEPQDMSELQMSEQTTDFSSGSTFLGSSHEGSRTCHICGKTFSKPSDLRRHMVCHTKEKNFKCEFCPLAYRNKMVLKVHMKKHLENKSLKCPNCPKVFVCDFDLKRHLRQVHPIDCRFQCDKCNFKTNKQHRLDVHIMYFHSSRPYKCNLCGRLFKLKSSAMRHLFLLHKRELHKFDNIEELIGGNGENLKASASLTLQGTLSTSPVLNSVENEGLVKIEDQSKEEPQDNSELQLSEETTDLSGGSSFLGGSHENVTSQKLFYSCDICGKFYQKEENFLRHCQQVHGPGVLQEKPNLDVTPQRDDKEAVEEKKKPAICHICGKVFSLKRTLRAHLKRFHTPLVLQEGQAEDVQFQCEKCDKTFQVLGRFRKHQKYCGKKLVVQNPVGHKSTTCHICGSTFPRYHYLKQHMAKHTKEKIFKCEYCPAAYAWESALFTHRKKHLENKSLECPKCSKIFVCDYDLKTHLRQVHPKEHRFYCEKCKYTTNYKDHLRRHLMSHSSFQPLKCNLCDKLFKEKKSVKRHLLVCHKMELNEKEDLEELIGKNES